MNSKNPEMHDCECGFLWRHGQSGDHSCGPYFRQTIAELRAAAAPQVVSDERVAQTPVAYMAFAENGNIRVWAEKDNLGAKETSEKMGCKLMPVYAAPVQAQEPFAYMIVDESGEAYFGEFCVASGKTDLEAELEGLNYGQDGKPYKIVPVFRAPVQPVAVPDGYAVLQSLHAALSKRYAEQDQYAREGMLKAINTVEREMMKYGKPSTPVAVPDATITLDGHQLRMALDLINPDGLEDRDQLDDHLTFGIRKHRADDETVSTGMCCWNDDTDGVLPLDGEYEAPAAPAAQPSPVAVAVPDGWRDAAMESAVQAVAERAGESEKIDVINAFDAIRSLKKNRHALPESCSSIAAPAAQGDAKDAINAELVAALKDITDDICERFDMESSSTNPGIKNCVKRARAAIAASKAGA